MHARGAAGCYRLVRALHQTSDSAIQLRPQYPYDNAVLPLCVAPTLWQDITRPRSQDKLHSQSFHTCVAHLAAAAEVTSQTRPLCAASDAHPSVPVRTDSGIFSARSRGVPSCGQWPLARHTAGVQLRSAWRSHLSMSRVPSFLHLSALSNTVLCWLQDAYAPLQ